MRAVEDISKGRVKVGPGTSYTLLDKFLKLKLIEETRVEGRKRTYIIYISCICQNVFIGKNTDKYNVKDIDKLPIV